MCVCDNIGFRPKGLKKTKMGKKELRKCKSYVF